MFQIPGMLKMMTVFLALSWWLWRRGRRYLFVVSEFGAILTWAFILICLCSAPLFVFIFWFVAFFSSCDSYFLDLVRPFLDLVRPDDNSVAFSIYYRLGHKLSPNGERSFYCFLRSYPTQVLLPCLSLLSYFLMSLRDLKCLFQPECWWR